MESYLNQEILKIASRRSSRCARIYTTDNSSKFEIELRNNLIKNYNPLLVEDCFEGYDKKFYQNGIDYKKKILQLQKTKLLSEKLTLLIYFSYVLVLFVKLIFYDI